MDIYQTDLLKQYKGKRNITMEAVANSVDHVLIDSLLFASYITGRKSVTFLPTGINTYKN